MSENLSQKIFGEIKKQKIEPTPKWQFLLKNYVIWSIGAASLVVGGLAFSVIIYLLEYNDLSTYGQLTGSVWEFVLLSLPYFWLIFLAIFILVVYYNFKHTKQGYRYSLPLIIIVSVIASTMLGVLFFKVGLGQAIDDVLGAKAPYYKIFNPRPHLWSQPEKGRLAGLIVSKVSDVEYILFDLNQHEWNILTERVKIKPFCEIQIGRPVELMGEKLSDSVFRADRLMPVGPGRNFFMRHKDANFPGPMKDPKMMERFKDDPEFQKRIEEFPQILEKLKASGTMEQQ